jgi:hypothetical protein
MVGSGNITWLLEIDNLLVYMVRRRGFKILWLRNIEPTSHIHFKGGDSEYYGCETLTPSGFPWLRGGGSRYGCDISNPSRLNDGDSEYHGCEALTLPDNGLHDWEEGVKMLWMQ